MIEINLLPPELRRKPEKRFVFPEARSKKNIRLALALLALPNILIPGLIFLNNLLLKRFEDNFSRMQPQIRQIDQFRNQAQGLKDIQGFASGLASQRTALAPKLNSISDCLSPGIWLTVISFSNNTCEIKGECVSSQGEEMGRIKEFLSALKADKQFSLGLGQIELSSAQRVNLGSTEVIEFTLGPKSQAKSNKKSPPKK